MKVPRHKRLHLSYSVIIIRLNSCLRLFKLSRLMSSISFLYVWQWRLFSVSDTQLTCSGVLYFGDNLPTWRLYLDYAVVLLKGCAPNKVCIIIFLNSCMHNYFTEHYVNIMLTHYSSITFETIWWKLCVIVENLYMLQTSAWTVSILHMVLRRCIQNVVWQFTAHKCAHLRNVLY